MSPKEKLAFKKLETRVETLEKANALLTPDLISAIVHQALYTYIEDKVEFELSTEGQIKELMKSN